MINAKDVELFWNGSAHEFYQLKALITLEHVNTSVVGKRISMCKTLIMKLTVLVSLFSVMTETTHNVHHVNTFGNDVIISLKSRPLTFVYLYTRTKSVQKQIVKYNIKSKYP